VQILQVGQDNLCPVSACYPGQGVMPEPLRVSYQANRSITLHGCSTFSVITVVPKLPWPKIPKMRPLEGSLPAGCGVTTHRCGTQHRQGEEARPSAIFGPGRYCLRDYRRHHGQASRIICYRRATRPSSIFARAGRERFRQSKDMTSRFQEVMSI